MCVANRPELENGCALTSRGAVGPSGLGWSPVGGVLAAWPSSAPVFLEEPPVK